MNRYTVLQVTKSAMIHECQDCGALVYHRTTHDAWHALWELADLFRVSDVDPDLERECRMCNTKIADNVDDDLLCPTCRAREPRY